MAYKTYADCDINPYMPANQQEADQVADEGEEVEPDWDTIAKDEQLEREGTA